MLAPDVCPSFTLWSELKEPLIVVFGALILAIGNRMGHKQTMSTVNGTIAEVIHKIPEPRDPAAMTRKSDQQP